MAVGFVVAAIALVLAGRAAAGAPYEVKLCADGAGGDGAQIITAPGTSAMEIVDDCHNPKQFFHGFTEKTIGVQGNLVDGSVIFLLEAPFGTKISRIIAARQSTALGGWDAGTVWSVSRGEGPLLERISSPTPPATVTWDVNSPEFRVTLTCPEHNCVLPMFGGHSIVNINNMVASFEDLVIPAAVFEAPPVGKVMGTIQVPLNALDIGGGITNVALLADGAAAGSLGDANGGRCTNPPYIFIVPCKNQVRGSIELDTTKLGGDGTHTLEAVVTDVAGQQGKASITIEVQNLPINTARPQLSGTAGVGSKLTSTLGEWSGGLPDTFYDFQWLRCNRAVKPDQETGCEPIPNATDDDYVPVGEDIGKRMVAKVTGKNVGGTRSALSAPSEIVPGSPTDKPGAGRGAPRLTGVKLTRKRFRLGKAATAVKARPKASRGTVLRFSSSEEGTLTVKIAPAKAKKAKAKPKPRTLTRKIKAGPGRLAFSGRIRRKPLRPGRYLMTVSMSDADGNASAPLTLRFAVLRG